MEMFERTNLEQYNTPLFHQHKLHTQRSKICTFYKTIFQDYLEMFCFLIKPSTFLHAYIFTKK